MRITPVRHFITILAFGILSVFFTYPLALHLSSGAIGAGAGDNMSALWNIWWARRAMNGPEPFFSTPALFAPLGTSLVLHSYAPLESLAVSLLLPGSEPITLYNAALLGAVFLNLLCAYAAARALTRDHLASFFAGVAFGGSPFLLVRLHGHLNVISAWGFPLLLLATLAYERRPGWTRALLVAGSLGILAYTDYYYAIFGVVLFSMHLALSRRSLALTTQPLTQGRRRALATVVPLIAIAASLVVWIEATGGTDSTVSGVRLRMTDSFNLRVGIGFLLIAALYLWKRPVLVRSLRVHRPSAGVWRFLPVIGGAALILTVPILVAAWRLWAAGDYESQVYFWRSAPPGIDVGALIAGNPLGAVTGSWTAALYRRLGIDLFESAVWIGIAPLALLVFVIRRRPQQAVVSTYVWIGAVFFVWSLGPYLRVFGYNTAFMLPQTILRFVPVLANARVPGRAFAVVALMLALLGALGLASIEPSQRRRVTRLALALVIFDFWPAPHTWTPVGHPAIYDTLKGLPSGTVLDIPVGMRDGFGARGNLDHGSLFYQTVHAHPQVGGFVARLSSRVKTAYESDPILGPLLDLSEGLPLKPAPPGCRGSLLCPVRYIVVNETAASADLVKFVNDAFVLSPVQREGGRTLFSVDELRGCSCAAR